ncbi:UDP-N-acetylmuramoyl-tripeptide--D-alanyl-D-alanine ligase [Streptococcus rupicaprae]|uniref:UDP-N-acetylmuramoyl-tripeptide--D-alanyl-D-alanine ligase n=1 Tax=Streptococcus rupicaprae TaxID=759619 RepID=A0ABV2FKD4_9STRE
MRLSFYEVGKIVGAQNDFRIYPDSLLTGMEFDSRQIKAGNLFMPLKGARDGHTFIGLAFENGAVATLSEKPLDCPHLLVSDVLLAMQQLASYYIDKLQVDVIAVTGSNGKTTTKDMIHDVLATTYQTYKTQGNYNNEIGLPYTVLHMPDNTQKLVLEMGQDHLGDIEWLSKIARPRISVVTLIGEAHLAFFGSRDKIAQGKLQITSGMPDGGLLLVPDDPLVEPYLPSQQKVVRFGPEAELRLTNLCENKENLTFESTALVGTVELPVTGKYNATNAMLAAYVGKVCGVSDEKIKRALAQLQLTRNRTEWKKAKNGAEILSDVYNANPTAMRLILETFSAIPKNPGGRKIVVLADMKELGEASARLHAGMAPSLTEALDRIYLYGPEMAPLAEVLSGDERLTYVASVDRFEELLQDLQEDLKPQDQLLLKGSNSMNLAAIVELLEA